MSRSIINRLAQMSVISTESAEPEQVAGGFTQLLGEDVTELRVALQDPALEGLAGSALEAFDAALNEADAAFAEGTSEETLVAVENATRSLMGIEAALQAAPSNESVGKVIAAAGYSAGKGVASLTAGTGVARTGDDVGKGIAVAGWVAGKLTDGLIKALQEQLRRIFLFIKNLFLKIAEWIKMFQKEQMFPKIQELKKRMPRGDIQISSAAARALALGSSHGSHDLRWHDRRDIDRIVEYFAVKMTESVEHLRVAMKSDTDAQRLVEEYRAENGPDHYLIKQYGYSYTDANRQKLTIESRNLSPGDRIEEVDGGHALRALEIHLERTSAKTPRYMRAYNMGFKLVLDLDSGVYSVNDIQDQQHAANIKEIARYVQGTAMAFHASCVFWSSLQMRLIREIERNIPDSE